MESSRHLTHLSGSFVPSCRHLDGWQGRRLVDNLDSVSLDKSRKIRRAVKITDLFERLRHSPVFPVPNTQYCDLCHHHNLCSVVKAEITAAGAATTSFPPVRRSVLR